MGHYTTFADVIQHGFDYLGGNPSEQVKRDCVRAALEAYRDLANAHTWSYLYTHGRIITSGAFSGAANSATIQYQESAGSYPYQVTLTGAVWPDWAAQGTYLRCSVSNDLTQVDDSSTDMVAYRVAERKSATVLTLNPSVLPVSDLPAGTEFVLYRDTYLLPADYVAQDQALFERNFGRDDVQAPEGVALREPLRLRAGHPAVLHDHGRRTGGKGVKAEKVKAEKVSGTVSKR